jgi:hypothetical protein
MLGARGMEEAVTLTTTQRRIGLSAGLALFAVAFFLILFDHRDGTLRMVALVSFGFLCLATVYRLIKVWNLPHKKVCEQRAKEKGIEKRHRPAESQSSKDRLSNTSLLGADYVVAELDAFVANINLRSSD